jgi:hypothetical protein
MRIYSGTCDRHTLFDLPQEQQEGKKVFIVAGLGHVLQPNLRNPH